MKSNYYNLNSYILHNFIFNKLIIRIIIAINYLFFNDILNIHISIFLFNKNDYLV